MVVPHFGLAHWWSICFVISAHGVFSHRRAGVGYALRVSPAVTRLSCEIRGMPSPEKSA